VRDSAQSNVQVERRVVLENGDTRELTARLFGEGLWLKPELDGDGEYFVTLEQLVAVLDELGLNLGDLTVGRWSQG
jgi:hypothetical protein